MEENNFGKGGVMRSTWSTKINALGIMSQIRLTILLFPHTIESGRSTLFAGEASSPSWPPRTSRLPPVAGARAFACNTNIYKMPGISGRHIDTNADTYLELSPQGINFSLVHSRFHPDVPPDIRVANPRGKLHQGEPLKRFDVHQFEHHGLC